MFSLTSVLILIRGMPRSFLAAIPIVLIIFCLLDTLQAADGDLDPTFSGDGKVITNFGGPWDSGSAVAIQFDGKIIAAGTASFHDFALARYNADGSLDSSFDSDGKVTTDFGADDEVAWSVAIQANGKIVAAGGSNDDFALARYNSDGSLDSSFDGDGKATTDFGGNDSIYAVAIQANGKIVVAGQANNHFALARYNPDGSLDNSFDGDGKVTTDFPAADDVAWGIAIQADGKIVAAGSSSDLFVDSYFALARYNPDGTLDTSFDEDGKVTTDFGGWDFGYAIAIQANGKIVVTGKSGMDFAVARYNSDGSLDSGFDGDGKVTTDFGGTDFSFAVAIQVDGKIVAAGRTSYDFALARYNSDGSLDSVFSGDGKVTTDFFGGWDLARAVAIQADGKIVAAGATGPADVGVGDFALARYEVTLPAWIAASPVSGGIAGYANAQCDDQPNSLYVISGLDGSLNLTTNVRRYDAASDTWNDLAPIPEARRAARAVCYQGFIYVMGGLDASNVTKNQLYIYDIVGNAWSSGASLPRNVWGPAVGVYNGQIFMVGGSADFNFPGNITDELNIYDIASNTWVGTGAPMPSGTVVSGYVQSGSFVYVVGGYTNAFPTNSSVTQRYDMATDTWEIGPAFASARAVFALTASNVALYAMGGDADGGTPFDPTTTVERLDLSEWPGGNWIDLGALLPTARMSNAGFCTTVLGGGEIWTTGAFFTPPDSITGTNEYRLTSEGCPSSPVSCLFCDEFDDGVVDPNWTYIKNISDWFENGALIATTSKKTQAHAIPIFSGCTACYAETRMRSAGGPFSKVWFLFHIVDKDNLVEVLMDESKDKWVVKHRINKTVRAKQKFLSTIDPNTDYTVRIRYDGGNFIVSINGVDRITLAPGGAVTGGSVGFKVKATTGTFERIEVN